MTQVREQLDTARKRLLDMSLRNKLLNFKEYRKSTATVVDEVPAEVYGTLVFDEQPMQFLPAEDHPRHTELEEIPENEAVLVREGGTHVCLLCDGGESWFSNRGAIVDHLETDHGVTIADEEPETPLDEKTNLWELPGHEDGESHHDEATLQTPHGESDLQQRLFNINNRAEALIEDAGYNALHLAIGFMEWQDPQSDTDGPNRAPLILVPVTIERDGAQAAFEVSWTGAEVTGNRSLDLKLSDLGFDLPEFERPESKADVKEYLETVEEAAADVPDWRVTPDIHLGFFDYTKFVMYHDLDPDRWDEGRSPVDHELVRALLDPDESTTDPEPFDPEDIDDELTPTDIHHVMDADPSQIAAIEDVKRGRNMVIEGPPGTGKSQTIVNMIAELIAEDKTVLFVSEKLAALEVVKERLDAVNLGDFTLELHSDRASKSEFLHELERITNVGDFSADDPSNTFHRLQQRREELNSYSKALGTPYGPLERTPYELFGQRAETERHFQSKETELPQLRIDDPTRVTPKKEQAALSALRTLSSQLETVGPVPENPWRGCKPDQILPHEMSELEDDVQRTLELFQRLHIETTAIVGDLPLREPDTLGELTQTLDATELLTDGYQVELELLTDDTWDRRPARADELIDLLERVRSLQTDVEKRTHPERVDREIPELLAEYRSLRESATRFVRPDWHRLKDQLSELYDGGVPDSRKRIELDLEQLIELANKRRTLREAEVEARELFGSLWDGSDTDPTELRLFSRWLVDVRESLTDGWLTESAIDELADWRIDDGLREEIDELREHVEEFDETFQSLSARLGADTAQLFGGPIDAAAFDRIESTLSRWQSATDELDEWARFVQTREKVRDTVAAPILEHVNEDRLDPEDVVPAFQVALADALLVSAFQDRPALAEFDRAVHEDRIEQFRELDRQSLQYNQQRVLETLVDRTPKLMEGASKSSQAGILLHEFGKERMHKPIRMLLSEAGDIIQQLTPCFMMSPLSVAKYLDPGAIDFDVVIFDEASQVRPEDAIGAIMRGDQVVMFGDRKQLPPTSFFDTLVDHREADERWEFNVQDVESILDLARSAFPTKRLKWHYRSRHESLIAVSNQEFYDNDLLIYPSPIQDADELGLTLNHLPDTVYDRGGTGVNRKEARAVAEAAIEHYREHPEKSLGVGTFSQAQQEAIQEELEQLRKENPEIDEHFSRDRDEHCFVKNLERIQGDERDVIFISVGYGYDEDGEFSHNFGPLSNSGGWRRLNVLITRARERCVVFSNFTADAIEESKADARGVQSLKLFLEYAENRDLQTLTGVGDEPESTFEQSVMEFIREHGYDVDPQVGCAGFRIDMAVPHPDDPERYVLGIKCDGKSYHDAPVARARDRQRQAVLEDRGWNIHRVWSTEWYRNPKAANQRLLDAVEEAVTESTSSIPEAVISGKTRIWTPQAAGDGGQPSLEDLQSEQPPPSLEDLSEPYEPATDVPQVKLSEYDVGGTAEAVKAIVAAEGPINRELLERRLVDNSDVERRGDNIKTTIEKGIQNATQRGTVWQEGSFYYPADGTEVVVRRRDGDAANINWVPEVEIEAAIKRILENQHATARDDLISQTATVLGFERTGERIAERVGSVIDDMRQSDTLEQSDGLLGLASVR